MFAELGKCHCPEADMTWYAIVRRRQPDALGMTMLTCWYPDAEVDEAVDDQTAKDVDLGGDGGSPATGAVVMTPVWSGTSGSGAISRCSPMCATP